jgi:hypothetical protein
MFVCRSEKPIHQEINRKMKREFPVKEIKRHHGKIQNIKLEAYNLYLLITSLLPHKKCMKMQQEMRFVIKEKSKQKKWFLERKID